MSAPLPRAACPDAHFSRSWCTVVGYRSGIDESTLKREGVCAASLPTTMAIIAGLQAQNALKFLLHFGEPAPYVGYSALADHFERIAMRPNPACQNPTCCARQEEFTQFAHAEAERRRSV